jgi:hypothetical protein
LDLFSIEQDKTNIVKNDPIESPPIPSRGGQLMVPTKCRTLVPFNIVKKDKHRVQPTGTTFMLDLKWRVVLSDSNKEPTDTLTQLCRPVAEIFAQRLDKRVIT